jgi:hypothetical protein
LQAQADGAGHRAGRNGTGGDVIRFHLYSLPHRRRRVVHGKFRLR